LTANEWCAEKQGLFGQQHQPPFVGKARGSESEVGVSARPGIDQRRDPESLDESRELASRRSPFGEIHEVRSHAALRKEALRLSGVRAFSRAEDLHFHGRLPGSENMSVPGIYTLDISHSAA